MRGEPVDIPIVKAIIVVANPRGLHDIVNRNTQLGQPKGRGVSSVMLAAATIGDLLASEEIALAFALRGEDCIGLMGAMVERTHEECEYPRMLDERAGAAAVVAAEEEPNSGILELLLLARRVTKGALRATVMLQCVGLAVARLLDFPLHRLHSFRFLWLTWMEQIRSHTSECEPEVWSWFSQKIGSGKVHFDVPEIDDRRWIKRDRQSVVLVIWWYRGYVKLYPFWHHWLLSS